MAAQKMTNELRGKLRGVCRFLLVVSLFGLQVEGLLAQQCSEFLQGRRLTLVVPYAAGGGYDIYARTLASVLESQTGAGVQVRNLPGAGGIAGITAVADARPENLLLGVFNPMTLLEARLTGRQAPDLAEFRLLGALNAESTVWASLADGRPIEEPGLERVIGLSSYSEVTRVELPALALGLKIQIVGRYPGTSDAWLAMLRGDLDVTYGPAETIARYLQGAPEATVALSLTSEPNRLFPGVPFLAGPGGVVDRQTQDLPDDERDTRLQLARLAAELSRAFRTVSVTSQIAEETGTCLEKALEDVLFSAQLQQAALQQGLELEPFRAEELAELMTELQELIANNRTLLETLSAVQ